MVFSENLHPAQQRRLSQFNAQECVDIHCHCLPGLDDGPADLDASLRLCRQLVEDGITTVVATPHQLGQAGQDNLANRVRAAVKALQSALESESIPLIVHPGGDVRLDPRLPQLIDLDAVLTLADRRTHLLLELPHDVLINLTPLVTRLNAMGITTILSHPERHQVLARQPMHLLRWLEQGMLLQVTSGSLIGEFGELAQKVAWDWLGSGLVALVASDAHGDKRPPRMTAAINAIASELGQPVARRVCIENPARIIRGEPVPVSAQRMRLVGR